MINKFSVAKREAQQSRLYSACLVHPWFVCNVVPSSPSSFGNTFLPAVGSSSENQFPTGSCLEDCKIFKMRFD